MIHHTQPAKPKHHREGGFSNGDPAVVIGNFPWYDMVWRTLRGDFVEHNKSDTGSTSPLHS